MKLLYIGTDTLTQSISDALSRTQGEYEVLTAIAKEDYFGMLEQGWSVVVLYDYCAAPERLPLSIVLKYARAFKAPVMLLTSASVDTPIDDLQSAGISGYVFREHIRQLPFVINSMAEATQLESETQDLYQALERTGDYYQTLLKHIDDFVFLFNDKGDLVYLSPSAHQLTGFSSLEDKQLFEFIHPNDRRQFFFQFKKVLKKPDTRVEVNFRIQHKSGHYIWIEGGVTNLVKNEAIEAFVLSCRDVTVRTEMEKDLLRVNKLYAGLRQVNRSIISAEDEHGLFKEVCRAATQHCNFRMAYVSTISPSTGKLRLTQSSGVGERHVEPYMVVESLEYAPFESVLRTGECFICNNVYEEPVGEYWRYVARQKSFESFAILPICRQDRIAGVLVLAAPGVDSFFVRDMELLLEMVDDVSFKLDLLQREKGQIVIEQGILQRAYAS